ncbi:GNAT family N-acetyltransferase [Acidobacteria bacterium AB60]|nr:GNAT family N-acetyltransferase [Acidobacteria bacterium AB60]
MASSSALAPSTAAFRRFNRAYTRFLGTLNDHYLRTDYSLAEGRVMYELAARNPMQAKEIAEALGLDPGYLSRILRKLERSGLVARSTSTQDKRAANLTLTAQGREALATLNTRADEQAHALLANLAPEERAQFEKALNTIEKTIRDAPALGSPVPVSTSPVALRTHRPGDMGAIVQMEGAGYVEQFGWNGDFEGLVARITADFLDRYDPSCERCWIAERDGVHLGHIFLVKHPDQPGVAKLRLLYVDPVARGLGIGQKLVNECVQFARSCGYKKITLWTQSILSSAHRLYQAAGFRLVKEEPHHSFGNDLTGQTWELELN